MFNPLPVFCLGAIRLNKTACIYMKRPDGCNRHCCVSRTDKERLQREPRCPALTNIFWVTRLIQCCDGPWPPAPLWCHCCWIRCHSRQVSSLLLQNIRLQKRGILSFLSLSHSTPRFIQCSAVNCYNHSQDGWSVFIHTLSNPGQYNTWE